MTTIAEHITTIVHARPGASFPELTDLLADEGHDTDGDLMIGPRDDLVMWPGLNRDFTDALEHLINRGDIHPHTLGGMEAVLVHMSDGRVPRLPIAKRPPRDRLYKDSHWLPVVWYEGAQCAAKNCAGPINIDAGATA